MKYIEYDMNAYKLHIIKTSKFKTITAGIAFRREIKKEEITIRNLIKELMINASYDYPTERNLTIMMENLYDLKILASNYRIGNDTILNFKIRFLNEKYTEKGMNAESIKFFLDLIFRPKLDVDVEKCKNKIEKSIISLNDNKVKYSLFKLLETTGNMPYAYNSYGYVDDLDKISINDLENYYKSIINNDIVDIYVVGDVDELAVKNIFKEYVKLKMFHKQKLSILAPELDKLKKAKEFREKQEVNQTQLAILCDLHNLSEDDRKYNLLVFSEMLGGSSNSILFDNVREKNSYAYYVNSIVKSYDNVLMIYSGIGSGNEKNVLKLIEKTLNDIKKGNIPDDKFLSAKETIISGIEASLDNPVGIINNYYAKELVGSLDADMRIEKIKGVSHEDMVNVSKKVNIHTVFILEGEDEENSNR